MKVHGNGKNIDCECILHDNYDEPYRLQDFEAYAEKKYFVEQVHFWSDCQKLDNVQEGKLLDWCHYLVDVYFDEKTPSQVNVSMALLRSIPESVGKLKDKVSREDAKIIFHPANVEVLKMLLPRIREFVALNEAETGTSIQKVGTLLGLGNVEQDKVRTLVWGLYVCMGCKGM